MKYIKTQHVHNRPYSLLAIIVCLLCSTHFNSFAQPTTKNNWVQYVNPFIGTAGHGHVVLGANVPFGAVQLGPNNIRQTWDKYNGWDWCSGYNYISNEIIGFTHTHLSGTGIGDLNDILIMPANGKLQMQQARFGDMSTGYGSGFSHSNETAKPGYYSVFLDKYNIQAELTATERVGFHKYYFNKTDSAHLLIDLSFATCWDSTLAATLTRVNDTTFVGYRYSTGWAKDQRVYFAIQLSQPALNLYLCDSTSVIQGTTAKGRQIKAAIFFNALSNPTLLVKVGISPVSTMNALANIQAEIPDWNFEKVKEQATAKWNEALGRVQIQAADSVKKIFYTALYHSLFFPAVFNDNNGDYFGADKKYICNHLIQTIRFFLCGIHIVAFIHS